LQLRARHRNFTYIVPVLPTLTTCLDYLPTAAWLMTACMDWILYQIPDLVQSQEAKTMVGSFLACARFESLFLTSK
jgi:hypothetical protein